MSSFPIFEVLQCCGLHGKLRSVYVTLAIYVNRYGAPVFPSLKTLARDSDMSRRHVIRCLDILEAAGYVAIVRRHDPGCNARNFYYLRFPWRDETSQLKTGDIAAEGNLKTGDMNLKTGDKENGTVILNIEEKEKKAPPGDKRGEEQAPPTRDAPPEEWTNRVKIFVTSVRK